LQIFFNYKCLLENINGYEKLEREREREEEEEEEELKN
jgi:hypothetical protein